MKLFSITTGLIGQVFSKKHPKVQASANLVTLDLLGNNDYFGPLFTGSEYAFSKVKYDTMSKWTFLVDVNTDSDVPGEYNLTSSKTAAPLMITSTK